MARRASKSSSMGCGALLFALAFLGGIALACAGAEWIVFDSLIGYECSGEGTEWTCVMED